MSKKIKVGGIADLQGSDSKEAYSFLTNDLRQPLTYPARNASFVSQMITDIPDICIDAGDFIDQSDLQANRINYLDGVVAVQASLPCDILRIRGNHCVNAFDGTGGNPTDADWFTAIDAQHPTRENGYAGGITIKDSYTYDFNGFRFIIFHNYFGGEIDAGLLSWLNDRCGETNLPIIIVTHCATWSKEGTAILGPWNPDNPDDFQTVVDAHSNVQVVFCGHWHPDGIDILRNDIYYISLAGSVWDETGSDNAYYTFDIISDAVIGSSGRMRANIKITGYGTHGVPKTKDFNKFVIM